MNNASVGVINPVCLAARTIRPPVYSMHAQEVRPPMCPRPINPKSDWSESHDVS
jgi:hypothetical protein